jgi:hypothetical protein
MKDGKLLELAAKVAGIKITRSRLDDPVCMDMLTEQSQRNGSERLGPWNPLTDDGDALRLAVKLQIQITPGTYNKDEFTAYNSARHVEAHERYWALQDEYAATRRAIVRAAAELAR